MSTKFKKLKLEELNRLSVEEYRDQEKLEVIAVLDNIRSLHNIGSFFRTADAFNIKAIYLSGFTAKPPHREIHKTALGATESVAWEHFNSATDTVEALVQQGFSIVPVEQSSSSSSLEDWNWKGNKIAVIFGNEVDGVSETFMQEASEVIEIPQKGTKHSLNVSVSGGIILWHLFHTSIK